MFPPGIGQSESEDQGGRLPNLSSTTMRSSSKNIMLSASASRSDDDTHLNGRANSRSNRQPTAIETTNGQTSQYIFTGNPTVGMQGVILGAHMPVGNHAMGAAGQQQSHPPSGYQQPRTSAPNIADLYCQVQEMDSRLRHLELFVFANPGLVRGHPNNMITIVDPSAVTNDDLGMNFGVPGNAANRAGNDPSDKLIQRGDLDRVCLPVLEKHSHPPSTVLNEITRQLEIQFPTIYRQEMLSIVRRWFRKRREEMSQRIFNACRKALGNREYTKEELLQLADALTADDPMVSRIRKEANLEIADEEESKSFSFSKIVSYMKRVSDELPSAAAGAAQAQQQ